MPGKSLQDLIIDAVTNRRSVDDILADFDRVTDQEAVARVMEAAMESLATRHVELTRVLGEPRIARENRLVPEYIEKFFPRASDRLGVDRYAI